MLSHLRSLTSLTLVVQYLHTTPAIHIICKPASFPLPAWTIADEWLGTIRDCEELRAISGLQTFRLRVFGGVHGFVGLVDVFGEDEDGNGEGKFPVKFWEGAALEYKNPNPES